MNVWDWVTAGVGLLLILSLFMKWFKSNGDPATGWQSLAVVDKLVLLTGLVAMALPLVARMRQTPADAQRYVVIVVGIGLLTALVLLYRIANPPPLNTSHFKTTLMPGVWVALALDALLVLCALVAMRLRVARRASAKVAGPAPN